MTGGYCSKCETRGGSGGCEGVGETDYGGRDTLDIIGGLGVSGMEVLVVGHVQ